MSVALTGFKFRPTKKELINGFLKPKIEGFDSRVDALVATVDLYKWEPGDLPGKSKIADEKKWYFLCRRERMGGREKRFRRKTRSGFWKSTCKVKQILDKESGECIADRTSLVYYAGTSRGRRTNWIIYEYSIPHKSDDSYVICRLKENRKKMKGTKNKADTSESPESQSNDNVAFCDTPSSPDVIPPENGLEESWNHGSPLQPPDVGLLDGNASSGNITSNSENPPVSFHLVVDDTSPLVKPLYSPEHGNMMMDYSHLDDSDVSPLQLSKSLFACLNEEQLFPGTSQQFRSLSNQLISPEIGMENLPECPVDNVEGGFRFPAHQLFGGIPSSS